MGLFDSYHMIHETEVHAYAYILSELKTKKGWAKSQIFTQNEIQRIDEIKKQLELKTPENIVKVNESTYYVIESKSRRNMLNAAIERAQKYYADKINKSKSIKVAFITGVAGNDKEGYIATSKYLNNGQWKTITENNIKVTSLLSKQECEKILSTRMPNLKDVELSEEEFLKSAEEINDILHENAIHKDSRAKFISAILLALSKRPMIDLDQEPIELVSAINTRVDLVLKKEGKQEFSRFIHIDIPSSEDSHNKLKIAITKSVQILLGLNIYSAMQSGKDILGKFYEVFLKYGNGAKEIGIVLTPRHITRFAAHVMDIDCNDLVLDPTCGTGGFLVAAFDQVKRKRSKDFEQFKKHGLYGIEQQDAIIALSIVNMIFRGDGKNNMIEGDCFTKWLNTFTINTTTSTTIRAEYENHDRKERIPPISKVLMNPPFPKKKTDTKEFQFIDHALKQMQDGGLLFSILPYACMIKRGIYKTWRSNLIEENTLLSVITLPPELFYPVNVRTVGIFIRKGIPQQNSKILWLRATSDGFRLKKGKRLPHPKERDDLEKIQTCLKNFLKDSKIPVSSIPKLQKASVLDKDDLDLEFCPETYLENEIKDPNTLNHEIEQLIRENIAFRIKFERWLNNV